MDKLKMQTANKADENFKKLAEIFPNAVTETIDENGEVVRAIDKDVLMQEINTRVVDGNEERYQFSSYIIQIFKASLYPITINSENKYTITHKTFEIIWYILLSAYL